jgi:hypothetical protein
MVLSVCIMTVNALAMYQSMLNTSGSSFLFSMGNRPMEISP